MAESADLYRKLLEIDPGSKAFYPYAELLLGEGRAEDAVGVLRAGLTVHPRFLEARLLLVEALAEVGREDEAIREARTAMDALSAYPSFWRIWADRMAGDSMDTAVALKFLATRFDGQELTWAELLGAALDCLSRKRGRDESGQSAPKLEEKEEVAGVLSAEATREETSLSAAPVEDVPSSPASVAASVDSPVTGSSPLHTRTMAQLLADQGDYRGAAEILEELVDLADNDERRKVLLEMLGEVRHKAGMPRAPQNAPDTPDRGKLVSLLERLAERLESRAAKATG